MIWRLLRRVISRQGRRDMGEFLRFRSPYSACAVRAKGGRSGARRFPVARNHVAVEMRAVLERARLGLEIDMDDAEALGIAERPRSEEHTSELQSLMRISYAVFCLKKKKTTTLTD